MVYSSDTRAHGSDRRTEFASEPPDRLIQRELEAVMPQVAVLLADAVHAHSCSIYVYDETAERTVAAFRHGYSKVRFPDLIDATDWSPQSIPVEAEIIRTRRPIQRVSEEDFEKWPMLNEFFRMEDRSYTDIVAPLVWHDSVYGAVYLWRTGPAGPFSDSEVSAIEDLAQIAAMSIAYARQYGEERLQRRQIDALLSVADLASSPSSVDEILPDLTRAIRTVTQADVCLLYVLDEAGETVLTSYNDGLNKREQWVYDTSNAYPVADVPIEHRIRRTLQPEVVTNIETDLAPGSELVMYARESGLKEILIAPIVYRNTMVGIIYSWFRSVDRYFTPRDVATVQAIANQAGGVVAQARLHGATLGHIQETETLLRIGQAVLSSDSLDMVLDEIAGALEATAPFDYAFVAMLDADGSDLTVTRNWGKFSGAILHGRVPLEGSLTGTAVSTGEIINVADTYLDSRTWRFDPQFLPIRSVLVAPLITERGPIGALFAGRHRAGYFTPREERLMGMLSQQAAVAIERVTSRKALALRTRRQTLVATVVDRLVAEDDPADTLIDIARASCGVLADGVLFGLASWDYRSIDWIAVEHPDTEIRQPLRDLVGRLDPDQYRQDLEELFVSFTLRVSSFEEVRAPNISEYLRESHVRELMAVPLFQSGRTRGLMVLVRTGDELSFDSDIQELSRSIASRIGDAFERLQMTCNREALLRASEALNSKMELSDILEVFYQELEAVIPCDKYYLSVLDQDAGQREVVLANTPWSTTRRPGAIPANLGLTGIALSTKQPVFENNAHLRAESYYPSEEEAEYYKRHGESVMVAPLIAEGRVIGSLFVGRAGANRFSTSEFETFMLFAGMSAAAFDQTTLMEQNRELYRASVEVLAAVVDAKDPTTLQHSRNVAHYSRHAATLMGLPLNEVDRIELAGLLHDIGKISIPDSLLTKPGPLTEEERALINEHPDRGASVLSQHPALFELVPLVRHHHEWHNGNGYPCGLEGEEIPIGASIICVADAFDTMISIRTYQDQRPIDDALTELERCAGTQFHPEVVRRFVSSIRRSPELLISDCLAIPG
jgi:putative nucleotidyltransferase with HDIG domain